MKTLKKIIGLAMAMVMMAMSFAVYAETTEEHIHDGCCGDVMAVNTGDDSGIMPLVDLCSGCGVGRLIKVVDSVQKEQKAIACIHGYSNRTDIWEYTTTKYHYQCSTSGCGTPSAPETTITRTLVACIVNG